MADVTVKTNLAAVVAPTVSDDSAAGYSVFSPWVDVAADEMYWCMDASAGAAVWLKVAQTAGSSYTGSHDFGSATELVLPTSATPTVDSDGEIALDTTVADWSHGIIRYYGGEELFVVAMPVAELTTPSDGAVVTYNATTDEFELQIPAGGGNVSNVATPLDNQIAVWTTATTIEGDANLTWDGSAMAVGGKVTIDVGTLADHTLELINDDGTGGTELVLNSSGSVSGGEWRMAARGDGDNFTLTAAAAGSPRFLQRSNGFLGIGSGQTWLTSLPSAALHLATASAATNTVSDLFRITSVSTGTPAAGIGVGIAMEVETSASNNEILATIDAVATDVTAAAEHGALVFSTMNAGAAADEKMRIEGDGKVGIGTDTPGSLLSVSGGTDTLGEPLLAVIDTDTTAARAMIRMTTAAASGKLDLVTPTDSWSWFIGSSGEMRFDSDHGVQKLQVQNDARQLSIYANSTGVAIGHQAPNRGFHVEEEFAATATVSQVARFTSTSSGTPAAGIGVGLEFEVETAAANNEILATIEVEATDVTSTSEDGAIVFNTMLNGAAAAERMRISSTQVLIDPSVKLTIPQAAAPALAEDGDLAVDTTVTDFSTGILKYYGGEEMGVVAMPIAEFTTPADGNLVSYNATNDEFELVAPSAASLPVTDTTSIAEGSVDATKEVRFEVDGNATGVVGVLATTFSTAKTLTFPDATDTLVARATTDTLTNKSIALGTNTITGTAAEFDTAVTDDDFAFVSDNLSVFAATTSAQLAGVISDETGSGALVFGTSPTIAGATLTGVIDAGGATSFELPNSATPTVNADGEIALDTTVTDWSHGIIRYFGGEELFVVAMPVSQLTTPTDGHVVAYNATNDEFELVAPGGGSAPPFADSNSIVEGSVDNTKELRFEVDGQTTGIVGVFATTFTTAKTLTFPDATDTVVARATTDTLTNKTIALGSNTVSGTAAEFDTAVTDDDFAFVSDNLSVFAATTSAQLAGVISDETGSGALVFGTTPTIAGATLNGVIDAGGAASFELPNSATPTVDADGEIALDITVADWSHGILKYFGGEEMGVVAMPIAEFTTPTNRAVMAYNSTNDEIEFVGTTGTGSVVYSSTPALTSPVISGATLTGIIDAGSATSFELPNGAAPVVNSAGEIAVDTTVTDHTGLITYYDGTEALYAIAVPTGNLTANDGHVIAYNATNNEFEMVAPAAASLPVVDTTSIAEGSVDATKEVRFEVDGNATGVVGVLATTFSTAKTLTFPDATDTLVALATTDTLTNKTIALGSNTVSGTAAEFDTACTNDDFAFVSDNLGVFAATTSAQLAGVISDETGSGALVFGTTPTIAGATLTGVIDGGGASSFEIPNSATPTVDADGEIAVDTTVTDWSHGIIKYFSGEELAVVAMPVAQLGTPGNGAVPTYNSTTDEFELTVPAGAGDVTGPASSTDNEIVRFDGTSGKTIQNGTTATLSDNADLTLYDAVNDGNPEIRLGAADAEELHIQTVYDGAAQTLDYVLLSTDAASVAANKGLFRFNVDGADILDIDDGGIDLDTGGAISVNGTDVLTATALGSGVVSSSLTSVGTISTGTWQGTTIAVDQGGTGQTTYTDGQLLIGNTTGNTLAKATLTEGTGITITNGSGTITIAADNNGDVVGPGSSVDNELVRFDSTTGKLIQGSPNVTLTDDAELTLYDPTNGGNPQIRIGASDAEEGHIWAVYAGATQELDYMLFQTQTASATANRGLFRFEVDDVDIVDIDDGGINVLSGFDYEIAGTSVLNSTTLGTGIVNSSLTSVGTITSGTWQGTTIAVDQGGTGDTTYTNGQLLIGNTTGNTLTKATLTGGTNLTVVNGTGSITLNVDDAFILNTGDTGTGAYDFGGATSFEIPNSATPTVDADGEIAVDTTVTDWSHGIIKYFGGEELAVVAMPVAQLTTPGNGAVPTYNSTTDEFELTVPAGAGDVTGPGSSTDNEIVRFDGTSGKTIQNGTTATLSDNSDLTLYDAVNDGNPEIRLGAADAEELHIQTVYDGAAQTLDYVLFTTDAASVTADKGLYRFNVDGTDRLDINDAGIDLKGGLVQFNEAGQDITGTAAGLIYDVPSGDIHEWQVNGTTELTLSNVSADFQNNTIVNAGFALASNSLAGTNAQFDAACTNDDFAFVSDNLSVFAATTSAQLAGVISDETGSGALVFGTTPTIAGATLTGVIDGGGATSLELPNSATPTVDADGEIALDTTVTDWSHGILRYFGGEEMAIVAMPAAEIVTPTNGAVPTYNSTTDEFEMVVPSGASPPFSDTNSIVEGSADATKELRFEVDGQTTGITGVFATTFTTAKTLTFPDATDTVVARATTDTLTNKTINLANNTVSGTAAEFDTACSNDDFAFVSDNLSVFAATTSAQLAGVLSDETGTGSAVFSTSPVLRTPQIDDTSNDHQYIFAVSELIADRTVTLPLLTGNDTFVFEAHSQTLTNKTIALGSNTVSGTAAEFDTACTNDDFAFVSDNLSVFAATTSAQLAGVISDETGSGALVFGTTPTIAGATLTGVIDGGGATSFELPNSAAPTVDANGEIALDTTVTDWSHGIIRYFGGEELFLVAMPVSELVTPANGAVPTYNSTNDEFEMTVPGGGGDVTGPGSSTDNELVRFDGTTGKVIQNGTTATLSDNSDLTLYDAVNDGNPEIRLGAADAEELHIQTVYDSAAQTLDYVLFTTDAASVTANKGLYRFNVDGTNVVDIDDSGITLGASNTVTFDANQSIGGGAAGISFNTPSADLYTFNISGTSELELTATYIDLKSNEVRNGVHTLPQINDTSADHQYVFAVSELAADRTVTLPLLTGNDTFVFEGHTQTLTNKTIALGSNTVSGTAAEFDTACTNDDFAFVSDNLSVFAATTSAQLAGVVSDETGSGALVFATSPSLTTPSIAGGTLTGVIDGGGATSLEIPNSATPTVDAAGEIAVDTTITDHTGLITYHDGTEALYAIALPTANLTANDGHVIAYNATNNEFEMVAPSGGSSPPFADTNSIVEGSADATKELRFEVDGQTTGIVGVFATTFTTAKTLTFPDATDTVVARATTDTLTNKTVNLSSNTLTGTAAQFDTACSDDDFAFVSDNLSVFAATTSAQLAGVISDETGSGALVFGTSPTLGSPVLTTPQINDTSSTHQYIFAVNELAADRTVTLPLLTGNDTFVFNDFAATLTNKTVNLSNNTLSGTANEFDTACSDDDFVFEGTTNVFTGVNDFGGATSLEIPNGAAPTVDVDGEVALDTSVVDWSHGIVRYFGGEELFLVAMPVAQLTTPANGAVPTYNSTNDEFELTVPSGTGDVVGPASSTDNEIVRFNGTTGKSIQNGTTATLSDNSDLTLYDAVNDGNPEIRLGAADAEELHIQTVYDGAAQTLDYVLFQTDAASATANKGLFRFNVDGTNVLDIDDGGIDLDTGGALSINGTDVLNATTLGSGITASSLTSVGTIATGTWNATTIAVNRGGTGQTTYTNGQLLIGNTTGNTLTKATLTEGNAVTITNGTGSITIAADAASTTAAGVAELATAAETSTGTDTGRTVTPDGLAGSVHGEKSVCIVSFDSSEAVATGDGTIGFTVPAQLNGMNLVNVVCSVDVKGVTGATDVQVRRRRAGTNADMLTTKVTIGDEFFASDETINTANDDVNTGDTIYIDVDAVHSGTAPNGLSTTLTFRTP